MKLKGKKITLPHMTISISIISINFKRKCVRGFHIPMSNLCSTKAGMREANLKPAELLRLRLFLLEASISK